MLRRICNEVRVTYKFAYKYRVLRVSQKKQTVF